MFNVGYNKKPSQDKEFQLKVLFFLIFVIFIFFTLILRIGYIQIIKNISYSTKSKKYREKVVRIPPVRGKIYSSDQKLLANNITTFQLVINPMELIKDPVLRQQELLFLSKILNLNYSKIENKLQETNIYSKEIVIADNLSFIQVSQIKENYNNLPGVDIKELLFRNYPYKDLLSHVIGYTQPIDSEEFAVKQKMGYQRSDRIGKNGIEKHYESILRGKAGKKVYEVDARMVIQKEIESKEVKSEPGNELVLTINLAFQQVVEEILADRTGTIIAMKPDSGEILAMASYPDYDPNIFILQTPENNLKIRHLYLNTKGTPLLNRNIQSTYPAASLFKLVSSTIVLNENVFDPSQSFNCKGIFYLNRESFKCWVYPNGHHWQNLDEAIMNSCDVYFYNVAKKVNEKKIQQYALAFGFNKLLGVDLPFENEGVIPDPEWLEDKLGEKWQLGHTLNTIIGQGNVAVTPLQVANFMSIMANKGVSYKPHLLKQIQNSKDGSVIQKFNRQKIIDLHHIDRSVFNHLQHSLRSVVSKGTASLAFRPNKLKIAGKTGTAEVGVGEKKQTHSWFAGFGPIDMPIEDQIVVVVLIEYENNEFLRYAAPIASMVFYSWQNKTDYYETAKKLYYPIRSTYNLEEIAHEN